MSAHAETGHGTEHSHSNESAIDTFYEGISNIISSIKIAVKKIFYGIGSIFSGIFNTLVGSSNNQVQHAKSNDHGNH